MTDIFTYEEHTQRKYTFEDAVTAARYIYNERYPDASGPGFNPKRFYFSGKITMVELNRQVDLIRKCVGF